METQEKEKKPWIKRLMIGVTLLLVVAGGLVCANTQQGEYIDGNVLNLPYINIWNENDLMDNPWKNAGFHTGLMYRNLFLADYTFTMVTPDMAEYCYISSDGLTYEIQLKSDLYWSDGEPLTVEDVVFSLEASLLSENVNGIYTAAFSQISEIETEGNVIVITLKTAYPSMIQVLAQFVILPEHCFTDSDLVKLNDNEYWKDPVVSGMYRVGEVVSGQTVQLVRNEYYSGTAPQIDEVMLHMNYKFTNLDYYSTNNITEIINYRSMRNMTEYKVDILFYRYLIFNIEGSDGNQNTAMSDPKLRQAIAYAIDRESLLYDVYLDSGTLIDSGVPRSNEDYDGVALEYDPDKAIALLAETDYDFDRPLRLTYYYTDTISKAFMEALAEDLEAVGFQVELSQALVSTELYDERAYDIALKGLSAFDVAEWYYEYAPTHTNLSKVFGGESVFSDLAEELNCVADETRKQEILAELQELEREYMYKIPLFTLGQVLYINEDRVSLPKGVNFGNTWYKYDVSFEEWSIKTD